ncbi:MAG: NAD(P)/FAD-dependent oxidoreductase [Saprospiraceae bacterium]
MQNTDFLIIGQGLAGTMLAHFLRQRGATVLVLDAGHRGGASWVAAGIINPVTGRRFARSWRIAELLPFAVQTYRALERELGVPILHERPLVRALFSVKEDNDWQARAADPDFAPYLAAEAPAPSFAAFCHPVFSYGLTHQSAQVNTVGLLGAFSKRALAEGWLREERFAYDALKIEANGVAYRDIQARCAVFCEGIGVQQNPYFNHLPIEGAKGEVLILRIPGFPEDAILKHKVFLVPLGQGLFWAGATYDWGCPDDLPTQEKKAFLLDQIRAILKVPFEVVDHRAATRPTVKDRRPLLGRHAQFPQLALFNGLGTKGASLAPYWANHFADVLLSNAPLDPEVAFGRQTGREQAP